MKLVYSGDRFRVFLQRNDISYKEAAEALGIDKNTVGKAVRGGNLNVDILLRICNIYGLNITDFFKVEEGDNTTDVENYYFSSPASGSQTLISAEPNFKYKKCENFDGKLSDLGQILEQSNMLVSELIEKYDVCRHILEEIEENVSKELI